MSELGVYFCVACGHAAFPKRLLCPACGSAEWKGRPAGAGVVEEVTSLRRSAGRALSGAVRIGSARLDAGPVVVVRLEPGAAQGSRVRVSVEDGAPVARPA